jgi:hypothetical protein
MGDNEKCYYCDSTKGVCDCGLCQKTICKKHREHVPEGTFSFFTVVADVLTKENYCHECYEAHVLPEKVRYDDLMFKAHEAYYLSRAYRGNVRIMKKHIKRVEVNDCDDRREMILRMAFMAAELGYNAVIDAVLESNKVRIGATKNVPGKGTYQTHSWKGSALPALIDGEHLEKASARGL